jgi:hypothetical protein
MTPKDIFAVGTVIKMDDGAEYTLRPPTQIEQGQFQVWLEQRAHDAVDRSNASQESKDRRHAQIDDKAALGHYAWDGPIGLQSRWMPDGLTKSIEIICRDQGVDGKRAEEIARQHFRVCAAQILDAAAKDPKVLRPLLGALGYPMDWFESEPSVPSSNSSSTPPSPEPSPNSADLPTGNSSSCTTSSEPPTG